MQKGHKHTEDTKIKLRKAALKRDDTSRIQSLPKGEKHWNYNPKPSKLALHKRLYRKYGRASDRLCVDCGKQARDWSNDTGKYTDKIEDYKPRCRKCHVVIDKPHLKRDPSCYKRKRDSAGRFVKTKHK